MPKMAATRSTRPTATKPQLRAAKRPGLLLPHRVFHLSACFLLPNRLGCCHPIALIGFRIQNKNSRFGGKRLCCNALSRMRTQWVAVARESQDCLCMDSMPPVVL